MNSSSTHLLFASKFLLILFFSVALNLSGQQSGDQFDLAKKAYASNAYQKANNHLELALKEKPNNDQVHYYKGKCKIEFDLYNEALDCFTYASNIDPQESEYYYYKGMCEWKLKRMQSAIASIEKALLYNPNHFLALRLLGCVYFDLNIVDRAKTYFDKSIEISPDFGSNIFTKSKVDDYLEAYKVTMRATNRDSKNAPDNATAKFYLGLLKTIGKDNWGAYIDFNSVAEIDPKLAINYYYKGYVEFNINKIKEAIADLNKYTSKFPDDKIGISFLKTVRDASKFKTSDGSSTENVLSTAEVMPEFEGGNIGLQKFIAANIKYPAIAMNEHLQGRVVVAFIIDEDGYMKDLEVLRGIGGGCEAEALRVATLMPAWKPGKQGGKNVAVKYVLPIKFALAE